MDETTENKTFSGETVTETISFLANEETQLNNDGKTKNFTEQVKKQRFLTNFSKEAVNFNENTITIAIFTTEYKYIDDIKQGVEFVKVTKIKICQINEDFIG